jgi:Glycosyltransferase
MQKDTKKKIFVYNGLDPNSYQVGAPQNYILFFSKIRRRVKGARRAIKLSNQYDFNLKLGGGSRVDLLKVGGFWDSWSRRIEFKGELGGGKKVQLFSHAKALLFPISWEEPFGLVLIEALLSGVPVIATPRGSVPEIINQNVGSFLFQDSDFSEVLGQVEQIDRAGCRQYAVEHFSAAKMTSNYLSLYQRIVENDVIEWSV